MKVILVDTFGFFFRSFYALPALHNSSGFPTSLLSGFASLILNLYKEHSDSAIIFALEGGGRSARKDIYSEYKANRSETPKDLLLQLPVAISWLDKMGLSTISIEGYEADDCIATLCALGEAKGHEIGIISHDKDLYQLISQSVHIIDYAKKRKIQSRECEEKFGIPPSKFIFFQSIVGDSIDNIPGVKGIGKQGAKKIIEHFENLESLYDKVDNSFESLVAMLGKRNANALLNSRSEAFLSRELVSLKRDLLDDFDFEAAKYSSTLCPLIHIKDELKRYEMEQILRRVESLID